MTSGVGHGRRRLNRPRGRRCGRCPRRGNKSMTTTPGAESAQPAEQPKRRRATRATSTPATDAQGTTPEQAEEKAPAAPRKRAPRKTTAPAQTAADTAAETGQPTGTDAAAPQPAADATPQTEQPAGTDAAAPEPAPRKRASRSRKPAAAAAGTAPAETSETSGDGSQAPAESEAAPAAAPATRAPRKRKARTSSADAGADATATGSPTTDAPAEAGGEAAPQEKADAAASAPEKPKRTTTRRRSTKAAAAPAAGDAAPADATAADEPAAATPAPEAAATDAEAAPAAQDAPAAAETAAAPAESTADAAPAAKARTTRRRATRKTAAPESPAPDTAETAAQGETPAATAEAATQDETPAPAAEADAPAGEVAAQETTKDEASARRSSSRRSRSTRSAEEPQDAATAEEETPAAEEAEPATGRRAPRKARSAGQRIDVLAAFSAAETPAQDTEDEEEDETAEDTEEVRLPATALLFQAPDPTRARRRARAESGPPRDRSAEAAQARETAESAPAEAPAPEAAETAASAAPTEAPAEEETTDSSTDSSTEGQGRESGGQRRRRRRGGRGRRNRGGNNRDESTEDAEDDTSDDAATDTAPENGNGNGNESEAPAASDQDEDTGDTDDDDEEGTSRRRRRRRRSRSSDDGTANSREGRAARDEITALKGSTRLEAKRQRRREGRDAGRRRSTITDAEFLARRESVDRTMVVREREGRTQIAVLEDGVLVEHYVARETQTSMVGNVYLGRVQNVLPSMEAAFVDLGKGRNAVLYAGEVNWDAAGMQGQPRRIEQALSSGDTVLVQVTKDPIGHKGARLTSQITLAGRYLVLVPSGAMTGISRKLPENERARLKKLLKQIVPEGAGVIVRTAAEGATEEQLRADVERLTTMWDEIQAKAKSARSAPVLLKGEPELAVRVVRDVFNEDFRSLTVSGDGAWQTISSYVRELSPDLADRMHHWTDTKDVFSAHRIDEQLAKGMDRKVYLPSGGSLVIDRTEAMTVVDVNTGKFTGSGGTLEETVTKNNLEAAEEIVRQLRLRDIGGIIVIDFIDMVLESNRDLVLRRLVECLGRDRTRHQVAEVTSLGLVQMTRKRVGQGLVEAFSEPCEHCGGRGFIVHDHPVDKSSGGGGGNGNEGGGRRRRRGGARQEEPAAPAEDPQAVAAREAVKATLATIAAAAAQAHEEEPTAKDENASGSVPAASTAAKSLPEGESGKDQDATTADNTSRQGDTQSAQGGRRGRGKGGQPARAEAPAGEPRRRPSSLEELTAALPDGAGRGGARADRSAAQPVQAPDEAPTASADRATSAPADQPVAEQQVAADESTSSPQDQPAAHEPTPAPRAEDQPAADEPTR